MRLNYQCAFFLPSWLSETVCDGFLSSSVHDNDDKDEIPSSMTEPNVNVFSRKKKAASSMKKEITAR